MPFRFGLKYKFVRGVRNANAFILQFELNVVRFDFGPFAMHLFRLKTRWYGSVSIGGVQRVGTYCIKYQLHGRKRWRGMGSITKELQQQTHISGMSCADLKPLRANGIEHTMFKYHKGIPHCKLFSKSLEFERTGQWFVLMCDGESVIKGTLNTYRRRELWMKQVISDCKIMYLWWHCRRGNLQKKFFNRNELTTQIIRNQNYDMFCIEKRKLSTSYEIEVSDEIPKRERTCAKNNLIKYWRNCENIENTWVSNQCVVLKSFLVKFRNLQHTKRNRSEHHSIKHQSTLQILPGLLPIARIW